MKSYVDAHCHFQDPRVDDAREAWLKAAADQGIRQFVFGAYGPDDWEFQQVISDRYPGVFAQSRGLHPWWVSQASDDEAKRAFEKLEQEWKADHRFAFGELGLDFLSRFSADERTRQVQFFEAQWALYQKYPRGSLILHVVDAHDEILERLTKTGVPLRGIVHSFSGNLEQARAYRSLGLHLSISGGIASRKTGKAFRKLKETVVSLKPSDFVLETDLPDQPPEDLKGELNRPESLIRLAERIGEWRGEDPQLVLERSSQIARELFF